MQSYDVVIIGAGHNGLTCAAYLGMAGLKVKVLERRPVVGGAAVTEEFCPGFRNSVAAYTVSLLNPKVIADLRLSDHGLRIVERRAQNFLPTPEGRYLLAAEGITEREIAKFSRIDAERYGAFSRQLDAAADLLRELILQAPPNLTRGLRLDTLGELFKAARLGNRLRRLSTENLRALYDLFTKSAADYLDGWFEGDLVKALYGFDAIVGNYASPYYAGDRLRPAAPRLRRGEREEAGLGPRDRRHGRDHAGNGEGGCRARRGDRDRRTGARGPDRERSGLRRGARGRAQHPRRRGGRQCQSQAPLYGDGAERRARCWTFSTACSAGAAAPAPFA